MVPNPIAQKLWWKKLWRTFSERTEWLLEYLSPLGLINSLVPKDGFDKHGELAYGPLTRQKLDVYVPRDGGQDLPVVVLPGADHFFHRRLATLKRLVCEHVLARRDGC